MNYLFVSKNITRPTTISYIKKYPLTKEIPKNFVFYNPKKDVYTLISSETGDILGRMCARPEYVDDKRTYYPNLIGYSSFYIKFLMAYVRRKGIGQTLINLAKQESIRRGCEGRIHLIAKNITHEADNIPIVAYRKMGFDSQYKWAVRNADKYISDGQPLSPMTQISIPMFLPVKNYCAKYNKFCTKA